MQIAEHLVPIVKLVIENEVVLVVAPTGTGKSLAIPAAIAETGSKCFISVPTRTAAISLAAFQLGNISNKDIKVGFAAEKEIRYNDQTNIVYVTSGHMRRKMLSYFKSGIASPITFCELLIVDEMHAGSIDNTVILSLWMESFRQE